MHALAATSPPNRLGQPHVISDWVEQAVREEQIARRQDARLPFFRAATVSRGGLDIPAVCCDISRSGLGILQRDTPPVLGPTSITLWLRHRIVELSVNIQRVDGPCVGWWSAGGTHSISAIEYAQLTLSRLGSAIERRLHHRYPFNHSFTVRQGHLGNESDRWETAEFVQDVFVPDTNALCIDISQGGICLLCDSPYPMHHQSVQLNRADDSVAENWVTGRVLSCDELPIGFYATDIEFVPHLRS